MGQPGSKANSLKVALLTGGGDRPYALGLAAALNARGVSLDFIGSNDVNGPELHNNPLVRFLNLRGDQRTDASSLSKLLRVLAYYAKLLRYAVSAEPRIFHILWNNKFEFFDRTVLMLYYRLLGKRLVFTAHNVNARKRDGNDSCWNRVSLRIQYRLVDHVFVHTEMMKRELATEFGVPGRKVSVIPFGINNTVPNTALTGREARRRLGLSDDEKVILFFGGITRYKGLEYAVRALAGLVNTPHSPLPSPLSPLPLAPAPYRLLIAGKPKQDSTYWESIQKEISGQGLHQQVLARIEYIPDAETEVYFKAADVLVLPYTHIFQSGVLFLSYSFGLPVIAADVGSLKEEIIEGRTGFVFQARSSDDLAAKVEMYFASDLYRHLAERRSEIRAYANERYSWSTVGAITTDVYSALLSKVPCMPPAPCNPEAAAEKPRSAAAR